MHCLHNPKNRANFELCLGFSVGLRLLEHLGREVGGESWRWLDFGVQQVLAKSRYFVGISDESSLGDKETNKRYDSKKVTAQENTWV